MATAERTLEVTLISAEELKKVRSFGSEMCYAVVYIRARDKKATMVDKEGGSNPTWNSKLSVTCDESLFQLGTLIMTVEIYSHGSFSNKLVGVSKIPLSDVDKQTQRPTPMRYEVRRPSGKVRGFLNLTVVAGEKRKLAKNSPMGYPPVWMPDSGNVQSAAPYPPLKTSYGSNTGSAGSVYPPPKPSTASNQSQSHGARMSYGGNTGSAGSTYPPPNASTASNQGQSHESSSVGAGQVYPPPRASSNINGASGISSKVEEPVMAYPAAGYGGIQYPPQQYGPQYPGAPQYYPPAQANVPYSYQQAYYGTPSRTARRQGGGGMGMGLLGGALGGLLLGDIIGDMGGF